MQSIMGNKVTPAEQLGSPSCDHDELAVLFFMIESF